MIHYDFVTYSAAATVFTSSTLMERIIIRLRIMRTTVRTRHSGDLGLPHHWSLRDAFGLNSANQEGDFAFRDRSSARILVHHLVRTNPPPDVFARIYVREAWRNGRL